MEKQRTPIKILLAAQDLIQHVGFNGFSYADIANKLGIKKASIHYHFPTKESLILSLIHFYHEAFREKLSAIPTEGSNSIEQLHCFMEFYRSTIEKHARVCLCSMLSAEIESLSNAVREKITLFFTDIEIWLAALLEKGSRKKELFLVSTPQSEAKIILSVVKGAQLLARSQQSLDTFDRITKNMILHYKAKNIN